MNPTHRLRELDFLRGLAIIFVLLRHKELFTFTTNLGWIGVDLFFTLSGFLVSGLLFKEFLKNGKIQSLRFLIRRGFKIYPLYYIFYLPYLAILLVENRFNAIPILSDILFIQNYICGWGYAYAASWSLAVEEHFYLLLCLFLWIGIKYRYLSLNEKFDLQRESILLEKIIIVILLLCLVLRIIHNWLFPEEYARNFTMTHLRIDSLLAGVLISYYYHFKKETLTSFFKKFKYPLFLISFFGLAWTPFIEPIPSLFVKTFGFTIVYISFGIVLIYFITNNSINLKLNSIFSFRLVNLISKIGFSSYSIYLIHTFVNYIVFKIYNLSNYPYNQYIDFTVSILVSILLGMIMTYYIESRFLKLRNKYFPST